uniref:Uncharacterized protein n=1 Tax=Anguilla anguilla TaxID=7936 RepID=A0A0E9UI45_ANGAN
MPRWIGLKRDSSSALMGP